MQELYALISLFLIFSQAIVDTSDFGDLRAYPSLSYKLISRPHQLKVNNSLPIVGGTVDVEVKLNLSEVCGFPRILLG
jgi:hypothetical protein